MGYGTRALNQLKAYYQGEMGNIESPLSIPVSEETKDTATLLTENIAVRSPSKMPPLLSKLTERVPESLDWLGVSFGLTKPLFKFWKRSLFVPVYLRQTTVVF